VNAELSIRTERLWLRKLNKGDAAALFSYRSLPEVFAYQLWRAASVSGAAAFIAGTADRLDHTGTWYQLGVFTTETPALIGDIGIHFLNSESGEVELGFTLAPAFQGHGYATEAVSAVITYLFVNLKKRRVIISVDPRNSPSRHLATRLGMVQTGCYDNRIPGSGDVCNDITYAANADDWPMTNRILHEIKEKPALNQREQP
jgi:RimJ/RimL family protein N-acetyltransferase